MQPSAESTNLKFDTENYTFDRAYKKRPIWFTIAPAVYNAAAKATLFVLAAGAAYFIYPVLTFPLLTIAATIVITRIVIKIGELCNFKPLEKIQFLLSHFKNEHRLIQIAGLIAVLVVAVFCWQLACVLAIPLGIYIAVVIGLDYYAASQAVSKKQEKEGRLPTQTAYIH